MHITFDQVTYRYAPKEPPALDALTLQLDSTDLIGICGRTGSGKSTFIQHVNGILKPTAGQVCVDSENIHASKQTLNRARQRIGMTFQFPERQLFGRTVWEELTYTLEYHKIPHQEQERRIADVCGWLDLDITRCRERSPFTLSRSEQRKLGIAVVLALQPELVILDEPTAGMDRAHAYCLLDTLQRLHRQGVCQVILVSHDIEFLLEYATYLVVLKAGKVAWEGSPQALIRSPQCLESTGIFVPEVYCRLQEQFPDLLTETLSLRKILQQIVRTN
jgi:energy-coupling factor transport system ATP-binding protein